MNKYTHSNYTILVDIHFDKYLPHGKSDKINLVMQLIDYIVKLDSQLFNQIQLLQEGNINLQTYWQIVYSIIVRIKSCINLVEKELVEHESESEREILSKAGIKPLSIIST